jgi:hypothetical protein
MNTVRTTVFACGILALAVAPLAWSPNPPASADIDQQLLAARESAWRSYFAGDVKTLGDLLPQEFIGIGMTDGPFADRATTLEGARTFREKGGRLIHLAFPETRAQTFGDAVVLYGRYEVVIESEGKQQTMKGRLTEMFVRRDGRWVHPGWHLDQTHTPKS